VTLPGSPLPFDDQHAPLYGVGQVASMLDVQPAFVRRLDTEGVVQPQRTEGGQRRYSQAEVVQVQRVSQMAGEGMTLAGIRRILVLEAEVARLEAELEQATLAKRGRQSR
jgi:MerR family transcriptional regulator, heat shock protein HspR